LKPWIEEFLNCPQSWRSAGVADLRRLRARCVFRGRNWGGVMVCPPL